MKRCRTLSMFAAGVALTFGAFVSLCSAQTGTNAFYNGRKIVIPQSSIPQVGRLQTNYFIVDPATWNSPQPPPGTETPGSLACVYELVKGPKGCPVSTSTKVPTGGVGAVAIVDAGYYPSAKSDLDAFSKYFGIPKADFTVVYANGKRPPEYSDWEVEEALDIEWAHAMAPKAKLFLVESVLCTNKNCNTDPTWQAVKVASNLVAQNGGGVVSMSWGDPEWPQERDFDHYFTTPGVVYFAASGDSGIGVSIHPGASPNVVSVGGTAFIRDGNGNFTGEEYGGGGGDISPYEPRPSYQDGIEKIVGKFRGYPDVGSDFCCAAIYLQGWGAVGGTSWSSPTMAGIVNSAGQLKKSTHDELTMIYSEYANKKEYKAEFYDITQGASQCVTGWNLCAGVGSVRTYKGK
jgi:kumamolisin